MDIMCPETGRVIPPENYNVRTDLAISPFTGKQYKLSELIAERARGDEDLELLSNPPSGLREHQGIDGSAVSVSTRNLPIALFMTVFTVFWNSGLLVPLVGPWLGGMTGEDGGPAPKFGVDLFMTLFFTPFILCGIGTFMYALMAWFGRFRVTVNGTQLITFRGVGSIGFRRRFDATRIQKITIEQTSISHNDSPMKAITLWIPEKKNIGLGIGDVRQAYLAAWLRNELGLNQEK
ncbi:MAG: hypothetical protein H6814_05745 [Phycisphaeraceae bacterium]|nr:hypothetical protein [Phycisphaeraceae bacterium]